MKSLLKRGPGRPPDEALAQRRTEEILDVATEVFAQNGFRNTDIQVVADALQLGKGTIYRYFPSKEELFLRAVDRGMCRLHDCVQAAIEDVSDPLDRVVTAVQAYLEFFHRHHQLAELLVQERAEFRDRAQPTYFVHRDAGRGPWRELVQGLIDAGRLRRVPVDRIMDVISDLVYGTMFTNHFTGQRKSFEDQARDVIDIVFHGILSASERQRRGKGAEATGTETLLEGEPGRQPCD